MLLQVHVAQLVDELLILLYLNPLQILEVLLLINVLVYLSNNLLARRCLLERGYAPLQFRELGSLFPGTRALILID